MWVSVKSVSVLILLALFLSWVPLPVVGERGRPSGLDEMFLAIESELAGFGGLYTENDNVVVVLSDEAYPAVNTLRQTLTRALAKLRPDVAALAQAGMIQVVRGNFSFRQLYSIKESLTLDPLPGMVLVDVDERRNRVLIGVEDEDVVADVTALLSERGVSPDAVQVEVWGPIVPLVNLRDRVRPVAGGLQIAFSIYVCTLGFVAIRGGTLGYVTNDHCTAQSGSVDDTIHYQPTVFSGNEFGVEMVDPPFFTSGCPSGYVCRYSDAVFGRALSSDLMDFGRLMRTAGIGSLDIVGRWNIVGEISYPLVGEVLSKVGRTTGWTQGSVTHTCVTTLVSGTNYARLCQDIVAASVGGGDSGSPVFKVVDPSAGNIWLYGVLWGSISGTSFVFSNMHNIEMELGPLSTYGYSVTFQRTGIPGGVEWGVTVNGIRYTTIGDTITLSGLSGAVTYEYDRIVNGTTSDTRYVCVNGCVGIVTGPASVTAVYTPEYRVVFNAVGLEADALGNVLRVNGTDYEPWSLPLPIWFPSGSTVIYEYYMIVPSSIDGKRYGWKSTLGMGQTGRSGSFTVYGAGQLDGYYGVEYRLDLSVVPPSSGITTPSAGSHWYSSGTEVVVRAFNKPLYRFDRWVLDGSDVYGDHIVVRMDRPHTLVAVFTPGDACFDFGRPTSPVERGCIQVTDMTGYTFYFGYGWLSERSLESQVRGLESSRLLMDFVYGVQRGVFVVDVPNGLYRVTVVAGDRAYPQVIMEAVVEGTPISLSAGFGEFNSAHTVVEVLDGRLEIQFYAYGHVWRVNAVIIEPLS